MDFANGSVISAIVFGLAILYFEATLHAYATNQSRQGRQIVAQHFNAGITAPPKAQVLEGRQRL